MPLMIMAPKLSSEPTRRHLQAAGAIVVAMVVVLLGLRDSYAAMWAQWGTSTFGYCYLILPIAVALAIRQRDALLGFWPRPSPAVLLPAAALMAGWTMARALDLNVVDQALAIALVVAAAWCILGTDFVRRMAFPLGYLFLMVPMGDVLIEPLMDLTANATVHAVRLSGIPVSQAGYVFDLPGGEFEVVRECSGIRFLLATVAAGIAFSWVAYRSWGRRIAFVAACCVVPVVANLVRAYGVVMLVHWSDMRIAAGGDHIVYGTIFFAGILLAMFWLGARYADPDPGARPSAGPAASIQVLPPSIGAPWLVVVAFSLIIVIGARLGAELPGLLSAPREAGPLPIPGQGWSGPGAGASQLSPDLRRSGRVRDGLYLRPGDEEPVEALRMAFGLDDSPSDPSSPVLVTWNPLSWSPAGEGPAGARGSAGYREALFRDPRGHGLLVWSWYLVDGVPTRSRVMVKLLALRALVRGHPPGMELVAVATGFQGAPESARQRLADFLGGACRTWPASATTEACLPGPVRLR